MLLRKPVPPWVTVSLFAVAVVMIPLTGQLRHRPVSEPSMLTELTVLLGQEAPSLYVVPVIERRPEMGIYICTQPRRLDNLAWLQRNPKVIGTPRLGRWEGVVFCESVGSLCAFEDQELQSWGEHGMHIGPILCFGDPALLRRIQKVVSELPKKKN
jgi:hypothetical protein